jgi:DNA-binding transcriptional LysR family regulator
MARVSSGKTEQAAPHLASGALVRVLEDWCPPFAGYFLYYPSRRQQPAALSALIDTLRLQPYLIDTFAP